MGKDYLRAGEQLQINLDSEFETAYEESFIHADVEDLRGRWLNVKPKIENMLRAVPTAAKLAAYRDWEVARVKEAIGSDLVYLRQLACCCGSRTLHHRQCLELFQQTADYIA